MNIDELSLTELMDLESTIDKVNDLEKFEAVSSLIKQKKMELLHDFEADVPCTPVTRSVRLKAYMIDSLLVTLAALPVLMYVGIDKLSELVKTNQFEAMVVVMLMNFAIYMLIHSYTLYLSSQTIGKKLCNIRIENLDGSRAGFSKIILLRYAPILVLSLIPGLGSVISWIDSLFIFRKDKRCLHDHFADTKVGYTDK